MAPAITNKGNKPIETKVVLQSYTNPIVIPVIQAEILANYTLTTVDVKAFTF